MTNGLTLQERARRAKLPCQYPHLATSTSYEYGCRCLECTDAKSAAARSYLDWRRSKSPADVVLLDRVEVEVTRRAAAHFATVGCHTFPDDLLQRICDRVAGRPVTVDLDLLRDLLAAVVHGGDITRQCLGVLRARVR
jgi:hypothetical protein